MSYYKQMSTTSQVKAGAGKLLGYLVSSTSSGTLKFYDSAVGSTDSAVLINTVTPAAGANVFFPTGITFSKGLYIVAANTIEVTIVYE